RVAGSFVTRIMHTLRIVWMGRQSRLDLRRLDDRLLRDVGLDPASANAECSRHFWQD
ncbi:MAG: DUF1127 domain-containing protein, partial [Rhodobacteraceae bacterium]|nr:DUF1127 domain-containing protein [Paracoccaceae bacterium]